MTSMGLELGAAKGCPVDTCWT
ncbi:uncharacterized protein G2W53_025731 [Senna tora]|uniref:Uncharacterized protein n=1 Tax=Senna tora TaxID=362788 RepID=A0A834TFT0_9FABA|nr:uncharacterized protein G2W53_025731 [Senna tora]